MQTLHGPADAGSDVIPCRICNRRLAGRTAHQLQATVPGGAPILEAPICDCCGKVLRRLVDISGSELCLVVHGHPQAVGDLIGGPALRSAEARIQDDSISDGAPAE